MVSPISVLPDPWTRPWMTTAEYILVPGCFIGYASQLRNHARVAGGAPVNRWSISVTNGTTDPASAAAAKPRHTLKSHDPISLSTMDMGGRDGSNARRLASRRSGHDSHARAALMRSWTTLPSEPMR